MRIFDLINNLDQNIIQYTYNHLRTPLLDDIMSFITHLGDAGIIWGVICILLIINKKYRKVGIIALIVLLTNIILGELILKNAIGRVRPYDALNLDIIINKLNSFSMPSGHALTSFSVAFVILFLVDDWKIYVPILLLATGILLSRVYLTVHYPSDVLMSVVIAFIVSWIVIKIAYHRGFLHKRKYE
ncbi:phosphatase PAP2 family protein [Vallitalea pronyensis]|nr:phosphatase PAP2 family protein [Vallitalea pronyensis]